MGKSKAGTNKNAAAFRSAFSTAEWGSVPEHIRSKVDAALSKAKAAAPNVEGAEKILTALEKKYFDLVWLARKRPEDTIAADAVARVRLEYPDEVSRLGGEHGDWEHGFNSGCLAAFRLALGLLGKKDDADMAVEEFPFLDT